MTIQAGLLPDGRRLHLNHGPIDLIIEAFAAPAEVQAAYRQAIAGLADVLPTLVKELAILRAPLNKNIPSPPIPMGGASGARESSSGAFAAHAGRVRGESATSTTSPSQRFALGPSLSPEDGGKGYPRVTGPVARRMVAACWPHRASFITPMAAVAGSVADEMLERLTAGRTLDRAYVNDGGDIAFYLAPGQTLSCGLVADVATPAVDGTIALTAEMPVRGLATSGRATKGQGGRSFSLGIADAVTVLARDAAAADAAATMIANAVDLPGHAAIRRGAACDIDPDSDLGDRKVTLDVGDLTAAEIASALAAGTVRAETLRRTGLIHGAVLVLRRRFATVGAGLPRLVAAA